MIADLNPYPAYKDSGVEWLDEVPEGWQVQRLKHASESLINGVWGSDPDGTNDIACVRVADFDRQRLITKMPIPTMRAVTVSERRRRLLRRGDLLLEKSGGGDQQPVGVVVEYTSDLPAISSNFVARMRPRSGFIGRYLAYVHFTLYSKRVNVRSIKQTTGIQNLDGDAYLAEKVPLAPTGEQMAIVRFLDHADSRIHRLVRAKIGLIELLNEERQAIVHRVVTGGLDPRVELKPSGVEWLGSVPEHWVIIALGRITKLRCDGPFGSSLTSAHYVDRGVRVIRLQNISSKAFQDDDRAFISQAHYSKLGNHDVIAGDLLIAGLGDEKRPVGRACVAPEGIEPAMVKADCFRFRLKSDQHPDFVARQLSATAHLIGGLARGSTRQRMNLGTMSTRPVALPPRHEQAAISEYLGGVEARIARAVVAANRQIALLREFRTRLIADVVTGKLDVRGAAAKLPDDLDADDPALDERLEEVAAG